MGKNIPVLEAEFGSSAWIIEQIHAGKPSLKSFEITPVFDLCAQPEVEEVVIEEPPFVTRADAGFSSASGRLTLPPERVFTGRLTGMIPAHA